MGKTVTLDKKQENIPKEALLPSKEANTSVINNENEGAKGLRKVLEKETETDVSNMSEKENELKKNIPGPIIPSNDQPKNIESKEQIVTLKTKDDNITFIINEDEGAKGLKKVLDKEIKSDEETIIPADVEKENEKIVVKDPETKKTFSDDINQKDGQEQTRDRTKEDDTIFTVSESTGAKGLISILKKEKESGDESGMTLPKSDVTEKIVDKEPESPQLKATTDQQEKKEPKEDKTLKENKQGKTNEGAQGLRDVLEKEKDGENKNK